MSLTTFSFNNQTIRTAFDSYGNAWFSVEDIAAALEYKYTTELLRIIDSVDKAVFGIPTTNSEGIKQDRKMNAINEFGLYSAITNSRKLEVKEFKDWIITQVLPSIRKTWDIAIVQPT